MVTFLQQYRDTCEQAFILSVDVRPECEEQNKRLVEWLGGESKALELLAIRMKHEEKVLLHMYHVILIKLFYFSCSFSGICISLFRFLRNFLV